VVRRGARVRFGRWYYTPASTVLALALVAWSPALLGAQRFTCEEARTILLSDTVPRLDLFSAGSTIMGCGVVAPGVVASALRRARPNSTADTVVTTAAWQTFDRRLVDSIRVMAVDTRQTRSRRMLYLQLLTRYALPGTGIDDDALGSESRWVLHSSAQFFDRSARPFGTLLILKEDRTRIVATIAEMGRHDPDEPLRRLAGKVAVELEGRIKESDANALFPRTWP
jgi:hypothetical protein